MGAVDNFVLNPDESLSYKFTVGNLDERGGFNYGESAQSGGNIRPAFMTVTTAPCDFINANKLIPGISRDNCYQTGLNGVFLMWSNVTGALPETFCRLVKGQTYYMNIRFQDARPESMGGTPTKDSCMSVCGGAIQIS